MDSDKPSHRSGDPLSPGSVCSKRSGRSRKSLRLLGRRGRKFHPYGRAPVIAAAAAAAAAASSSSSSVKSLRRAHTLVSNCDFFNGITLNHEFGRDFLREMDTPICTSKVICLPLDLDGIAPGRCLVLSPLGHACNMGFYCDRCCGARAGGNSTGNPYSQFHHHHQGPGSGAAAAMAGPQNSGKDDLHSVTLTFYNQVSKVVQNKHFYLSLLSHSLTTIKKSFVQPGLLYGYTVLRTLCDDVFPIFKEAENGLCMFALFKRDDLHVSETCLRHLVDNLDHYRVTLDCVKHTYMLKFSPVRAETNGMTIQEVEICEAITGLDFTDEIKQEIISGQELVAEL
ncbi:nuclear egress lamina protein [Equid gammaherpesvirus 5]|uniref:Nuclear egress lamina protein n=1 Tax=Equid gammaherpesvirus 5 TaxID=10371 RepID=A0A0B4Q643_9GAMA|nr:nuclear egress lamina protein [Equid gammaherpesvirus 5]AIU39595.1 nuclear egress lamina protein [Equid gammaherpesvirus 5]APT43400.1 nuclear egress lamina protein [Equid gammaherpesvirus 5]UTK45491.1 nuclear egress lamina protein [Equid gammaherpesvirus 5]UTK45570.1 nuclear egress lamina protein [Equid gammaherpesvirus 5]UTK45649.1 nuclear egress lamina protein [Equid gammaherpesvirus 5]